MAAPRNQSNAAVLAQLLERSDHQGKTLDEIKTAVDKLGERHESRFGKVEERVTKLEGKASEARGAGRLAVALAGVVGGIVTTVFTTIGSYVLGR